MMDPLRFGDLVRIVEPAVKWAREVTSADQLPILVRRAFHDANAAPTGLVFLSLPMDVMQEMSAVGIAGRSQIDRGAVAGSLHHEYSLAAADRTWPQGAPRRSTQDVMFSLTKATVSPIHR